MTSIGIESLVMIGCGYMGQALLEGWLSNGLQPDAVHVQDPQLTDWLLTQPGLHVNGSIPAEPSVLVIAVKPKILGAVLPPLAHVGGGQTLVLSIVTGAPLSYYETIFGKNTPIVRAMPNLPTAVGAGVTVYSCNTDISANQKEIVSDLFSSVGTAIELKDEDKMHAVTGISGSGPAYIFAMAEAMVQAGKDMGLSAELASNLAIHTIAGAGKMMMESASDPSALRNAVTSKGGTTAEALKQLMANENGLFDLMKRTTRASRDRSIELGGD